MVNFLHYLKMLSSSFYLELSQLNCQIDNQLEIDILDICLLPPMVDQELEDFLEDTMVG